MVRRLLLVATLGWVAAGCGLVAGRPTPEQMAVHVARLEIILPGLEGLRVSEFEFGGCLAIAYGRGWFASAAEGCERPGFAPFDAIARADAARLEEAFSALAVPTTGLRLGTYDRDGRLVLARFALDDLSLTEGWEYLYDPGDSVPKVNVTGGTEFLRIDRAWWLVISRDH